jgi:hypothetical protein
MRHAVKLALCILLAAVACYSQRGMTLWTAEQKNHIMQLTDREKQKLALTLSVLYLGLSPSAVPSLFGFIGKVEIEGGSYVIYDDSGFIGNDEIEGKSNINHDDDVSVDVPTSAVIRHGRGAGARAMTSTQLLQPTEPKRFLRGSRPVAVGAHPAGSARYYVLNTYTVQILPGGVAVQAPNFVDVLDAEDRTYDARIDLDRGDTAFYEPQDMALSADGSRLVVAARGSDREFFPNNPVPPHLAIIDTAAAAFVKRIVLDDSYWPTSVVLSPDGKTIYAATTILDGTQITGQQTVLIVDVDSGQVQARIDLPQGGRTGEIVITPDGALLFLLANLDGARLYEIDVRTRTIVTTIEGSPLQQPTVAALLRATELAINPQGTKLYISDAAAPQSPGDFETVGIGVVDIATARLTDLIPLPGVIRRGTADDIQSTNLGRTITHMDGVSGLVTVLDAVTFGIVEQTDVGDALWDSAIEGR